MVMSRRSVHLNHTFPWQAWPSGYPVIDNNRSGISRRRRMTTKLFHDQTPQKNGTGPGSNSRPLTPLDLQLSSLPTALHSLVFRPLVNSV